MVPMFVNYIERKINIKASSMQKTYYYTKNMNYLYNKIL